MRDREEPAWLADTLFHIDELQSLIQSFSSFGFYPTEWFQETLIWLLLQVLLFQGVIWQTIVVPICPLDLLLWNRMPLSSSLQSRSLVCFIWTVSRFSSNQRLRAWDWWKREETKRQRRRLASIILEVGIIQKECVSKSEISGVFPLTHCWKGNQLKSRATSRFLLDNELLWDSTQWSVIKPSGISHLSKGKRNKASRD